MNETSMAQAYSDEGYSYNTRWGRKKTEWAGIGVGEAFKTWLEYYIRLPGQKIFFRWTRKLQKAVLRLAGVATGQVAIKPQLGPCHTDYPAAPAAWAAIGLTSFLEFKHHFKECVLENLLKDYLVNPAASDGVAVNEEVYKHLAQVVVRTVENRLLVETLTRHEGLQPIEFYRLFIAAQQSLRYRSLKEIVDGCVLYGDLLPDVRGNTQVHPQTQDLIEAAVNASGSFFARLNSTPVEKLVDLGLEWVPILCQALAPFMPPPQSKPQALPLSPDLPPLNAPQPPALLDPSSPAEQMAAALGKGDSGTEGAEEKKQRQALDQTLIETIKILEEAGGKASDFDDVRSDILRGLLRHSAFETGPLEGTGSEGQEVDVSLGGDQTEKGELFDRPVQLSDDLLAHQRLLSEARPLAEAMRRVLYPNVEKLPRVERFCGSGPLDSSRLGLYQISDAIYKRYPIQERPDRRGKPLVVLACDGSGSLNQQQMHMVKVLAAAWLESINKSNIQLLAALYHSGNVRWGASGPLVQWIFHPEKTPTLSRADATRAVAALPDRGTGGNSDALSLGFILQEARRLARGRMVYLILISDTAWNPSFRQGMSGHQEVAHFFRAAKADWGDKLHGTLVALGNRGLAGFDKLLDKVLPVTAAELTDPGALAGKIGLYVATVLRERRQTKPRD